MTTRTPLTGLRGLIPDDVGEVLADLAATIEPPNVIVELGSYKGKSTCYLASGAAEGSRAKVYAVDAWDLPGNETGRHGYAEKDAWRSFVAQVQACGFRLGLEVTRIQGWSVEVGERWPIVCGAPVGMLYIDADHSYDAVWGDFWTWYPHLADGAVVAFDDWHTPRNPGVEQAVARIARGGHLPDLTIHAERLAVAHVRKGDAT